MKGLQFQMNGMMITLLGDNLILWAQCDICALWVWLKPIEVFFSYKYREEAAKKNQLRNWISCWSHWNAWHLLNSPKTENLWPIFWNDSREESWCKWLNNNENDVICKCYVVVLFLLFAYRMLGKTSYVLTVRYDQPHMINSAE